MELKCPACGSEEIYRGVNRRKHIIIWYMLSFVLPAALFVPRLIPLVLLWALYPILLPLFETWRCRACGTRAVSA
ncbi:MAG TPA: hypothetical protein VEK57_26055 [Thermoanaerobaculia bacterium]|nr:hypothetical protein [Thermoanaerobaculia bacterium]